MLEQADDFLAECEALHALLAKMRAEDWETPTQFKAWTPNDVLVHLYFWNKAADVSSTDEQGFLALLDDLASGLEQGGLRAVEDAMVSERGETLMAAWREHYQAMADRWRDYDPKRRVKWAGPDMSVRSSISARQMETWAHAHEVFDLLGVTREETDRIRNVVRIGINTFGWSFMVNGLEVPPAAPRVALTAPSGAVWTFGEAGEAGAIEGSAVAFAQVVTQTRNVADTDLSVHGEVAEKWMAIAQCFAGPPEPPPPPGRRRLSAAG